MIGALTAMKNRPDGTPLLEQLNRKPGLIIQGTHDPVIPLTEALELACQSGGELVAIDGAGHLLMLEQPLITTAAPQKFLT